ncbi:ABC transporter permease [Propionicicella superfundia]|uniref:ABC transporter permease n=1 Tax=Propionicicella superfundia TaxID=348582 RepID=UPI000401C6BA|nr:ABC transporter permease subunit [Propionicicella superfundia]
MNWAWIQDNRGMLAGLLWTHVVQSVVPVLAALVISIPLGRLVYRGGRAVQGVVLAVLGVVYSIPSLALFVALPVVLGTRILDPVNVMVALTIYCVALLVRSVVDGFSGVPPAVRSSAEAMGFGPFRRVWAVELPLAVPVIVGGLRVATVSNIALVSVGAVIGQGALGRLFDQGFEDGFLTPILVGLVLSVALALVADAAILLGQRLAAPWLARGRVS